jgi:hypothetical protein
MKRKISKKVLRIYQENPISCKEKTCGSGSKISFEPMTNFWNDSDDSIKYNDDENDEEEEEEFECLNLKFFETIVRVKKIIQKVLDKIKKKGSEFDWESGFVINNKDVNLDFFNSIELDNKHENKALSNFCLYLACKFEKVTILNEVHEPVTSFIFYNFIGSDFQFYDYWNDKKLKNSRLKLSLSGRNGFIQK